MSALFRAPVTSGAAASAEVWSAVPASAGISSRAQAESTRARHSTPHSTDQPRPRFRGASRIRPSRWRRAPAPPRREVDTAGYRPPEAAERITAPYARRSAASAFCRTDSSQLCSRSRSSRCRSSHTRGLNQWRALAASARTFHKRSRRRQWVSSWRRTHWAVCGFPVPWGSSSAGRSSPVNMGEARPGSTSSRGGRRSRAVRTRYWANRAGSDTGRAQRRTFREKSRCPVI